MAETTREELRAQAEMLSMQYNEAVQSGKYDEAAKLNDDIEQLVNEYTAKSREKCFAALIAAEDTMLEACKTLFFQTIRAIDRKIGEEKIPVREIVDVERPIDLLCLHKQAGGIGKDKKWPALIEQFNLLLTVQKAQDLGIDPKSINDSYAISDIAKQIDFGKTPTSKTNLLRTLQTIINAMIGDEYKAKSHDVNFLLSIYSRKNRKALTVTCANHKYLRQYISEICHRLIFDKTYDIEYKVKK